MKHLLPWSWFDVDGRPKTELGKCMHPSLYYTNNDKWIPVSCFLFMLVFELSRNGYNLGI